MSAFAIRTGEAIVNVGAALIKVGTLGTVDEQGKTILDQAQAGLHATYDALEALKTPLNSTFDTTQKLFGAVEQVADGMAGKFGAAYTATVAQIQDFSAKSHAAFGGFGDDVTAAAKKSKDTIDPLIASMDKFEAESVKAAASTVLGFGKMDSVLMTLSVQMGDTIIHGIQASVAAPESAQQIQDALSKSLNAGMLAMPDLSTDAQGRIQDLLAEPIVQGFDPTSGPVASAIEAAFKSTPDILVKALTGGGGMSGALKSIGSKFGDDLAKDFLGKPGEGGFADTLTNTFGDTFGGILSSAIPAVGSLIGPLISDLFNIGGPSKTELQGRQTESQFEQTMGGWQGIQQAMIAAGQTADQANAHMQALWASEKSGTAAVQTQITAINAIITQHTTDVSNGVQSILDAAKNVGTNFPTALQPMVTALANLPGLTDTEKTSLLGLVNQGVPSLQTITTTAQKYGLTLDQLGTKTQQLDISTKADQAVTDYNMLTQSGADTGTVINAMGTSVSGLVEEAIKYGGSLPTALQPIATALLNAGELTDAVTGKALDLSSVKFDDSSDPLSQSLNKLTAALNNLTTLLGGLPSQASSAASGIAGALNSIQVQPIHVQEILDQPSVQQMAAGGQGTVFGPTLFLAGEAGREDFAFSGAGKTFASGGAGDTHGAAILTELQNLRRSNDGFQRVLPTMLRDAVSLANP